MIERAEFMVTYTFQEIGFDPAEVNGLSCRFAEARASLKAMSMLMQEFPELRAEDYDQFEFLVDWVSQEIEIRESEYVFAD